MFEKFFPTAKHPGSASAELQAAPKIPTTASPTPWLTSLHLREGRGPYGSGTFRGNCSGLLIRDLLLYYRPRAVLDPMSGSGTCRDVCRELGIACQSLDLATGFDAASPAAFARLGTFDFVWLHPPYWKMIRYGEDPRCLSQSPTLADFCERLRCVFRNCAGVLHAAGKLAVLIGDGREAGRYWALPFRAFGLAAREGLRLAAPEIIRASHGASSSHKTYATSFIPRLHDVCLVLQRDEARRS